MDFYRIGERSTKNGVTEVYPDFIVARSKDLMVRGGKFYAVWDEQKGLWSTDEYDVQRLVDEHLFSARNEVAKRNDGAVQVKLMSEFGSGSWRQFRNYMANISDSAYPLDTELVFSNTEVKKSDYISRRLPYPLESGDISAYDELISTLYDPQERAKLEWAVGAIVAGDAKHIQKFIVLYGDPGGGKGTFLDIVKKLFPGYFTTFEAKSLTGSSNSFSAEVFRDNPLVAIDGDGDLSKIEDNTKLNSIVAHEDMTMNEKFKAAYTTRLNAFLFMGSNKPVKISDAKSGIIRRLIDVRPSGRKVPPARYHVLVNQINFELGAIANHCLEVYREMGKDYFSGYRPVEMMLETDAFYNFIEANFYTFRDEDGISLSRAYELYKEYCADSELQYKLPKHRFREELKNYFGKFDAVTRVDGHQVRSYFSDFLEGKFLVEERVEETPYSVILDDKTSILDDILADFPAQYANKYETPNRKWSEVTTTLKDLDTSKLHYVKPPENHIVIDFDLKDENGEKSAELNLKAASEWPSTYAEWSKSGNGIHLHYTYQGDTDQLSRIFAPGIEVKVFVGDASLRRVQSASNNVPVATITGGLPLREKKVINFDTVKSERALRDLITRNLRKEIHAGTKPSIDFIHKILKDAYESELNFDLTDLRPSVLGFAMQSTNQAAYCIKLVSEMKFKSEEPSEPIEASKESKVAVYDVEVFPNLFVVSWSYDEPDAPVHGWVNPTPQQIEELLQLKLVGFNVRRYDNHMLYARYMGYDNQQLYELSQRIINKSPNAFFAEAYGLSYADIYDYSAKKQSLKRWQIELGLNHHELGLPWDEPVPEEMIPLVVEYCNNDVITTRQVKAHLAADFKARQILAELSGLTVNDTTQRHTARIIFGKEREPQKEFVYTNLADEFPGYTHSFGKSEYKDEDPGEGGYVYAEPGMYENVALLDVESMHPTSLIQLNHFGPYTKKFEDLLVARLAIKHKDFDKARKMLDGRLKPYLEDENSADNLSYALKIIINIVYGMTSAKFDNPFRDPRNVDNIVAKRGALFMIDLKHEVEARGFTVAHIKTDSIKIPNATPEIIEFVMEFGRKYGYTFDHEATYEKLCLVNDAVYVAKTEPSRGKPGKWTATGTQMIHPYTFKTLFSHEPIKFEDMCETKSVTTSLWLDYNEDLDGDEHDRRFVGRAGSFCPMQAGVGGGLLLREKEGKYHSASGAKGYRWMESDMVKARGMEELIDRTYFDNLASEAVINIGKHGDVSWFLDEGE